MNQTQHWLKAAMGSALLCIAAIGGSVSAQTASVGHSSDQIKVQYETDLERCNVLSRNEMDVCNKQTTANRDGANADAEGSKKAVQARHDAVKVKHDPQYMKWLIKIATLSLND